MAEINLLLAGYYAGLFIFAINGIIYVGHKNKLQEIERRQNHLNRQLLATRSRR